MAAMGGRISRDFEGQKWVLRRMNLHDSKEIKAICEAWAPAL
jgi:hypothetical protein